MPKKLKTFVGKVFEYMNKPEMLTLPTSLAYYFVLAIVPIISLLLLIATNLNLSTSFITNFFEKNFTPELASMLTPMVTNQGLSIGFIIYLVVAFFIVSNGADAIIIASNLVFNIKNKSYLKRRGKSSILALVLILLLSFLLIVPVFGEQLINIFGSIGLDNKVTRLLLMLYPILRIPITLIVIYIAIKTIYIIAPDENIKSEYVTKGAVFTTLGWFITTIFYSYYIKHMATYNVYYAGLSTLVMLMVWFYLLAYILVIGLSMNYKITEQEIEKTNTIELKEIEEKTKIKKTYEK